MQPGRDFGAHAHTKPCGPEPSDSGPHYQNVQDPAATADSPSTDPAYANPQNEVWLDFTTDGSGVGYGRLGVPRRRGTVPGAACEAHRDRAGRGRIAG
ncbi:hypothetical protein GCM10023353_03860 [Tomitella cavernea]|uniref:Uncharacterized protein n=1 Tax=Tomitella cavernea TaxID=1387982 RepID=A0ABP9C4K2_9ACTN